MAEHPIQGLMETAMQSIKEMVDVNTIVGDPVESSDGTVMIPISKVSFGFGAGGSEFGDKSKMTADSQANFGGGSGGGVSIEPVAFMVIGQGQIKLLPIDKPQNPINDIVEKVPTLIEKFLDLFKKKDKADSKEEPDVQTIETVTFSE